METIIGKIERALFRSEDNGFTVLLIRPESTANDDLGLFDENLFDEDNITVTGYMPACRIGDEYEFQGDWIDHPKYGKQFKFTKAELRLPSSRDGTARYLASICYGVGPKKAEKIVDTLGENCIERIQNDPGCLDSLDFLSAEQKEEITNSLISNAVQAELSAMICGEGITPRLAAKIYAHYGDESIKIVKENPYILADEMWGVGFATADKIAQSVGVEPNSPYRIESAVKYALTAAGEDGHVYLKPKTLIEAVQNLCGKASGITIEAIGEALDRLIASGIVIKDGLAIYHQSMYHAEQELAAYVQRQLDMPVFIMADIDGMIEGEQRYLGIDYAPEQIEAIKTALLNPLSIITGGPGTGKSTVINTICSIYSKLNPKDKIYLAAPTGRASKRISETTGREAKTIHRLLRYMPDSGMFEFGYGNPLPGPGLLIVDEFSMCDIKLARDLFAAIDDLQVVLVGDVDQLPSVGPGSVLRDMILSEAVPTVRLKYNFRQAGGSVIARYANLIAGGMIPTLANEGDFEYCPVNDADEAAYKVAELVRDAFYNRDMGIMDFQVLAPMRKSSAGVNALNEIIKNIVNPPDPSKPERGCFRLGDKVMVIKNNYGLGVFNGDIGVIVAIDKDCISVKFDENDAASIVDFMGDDSEILTLAYASTIHKSQGSEFPLVIMPLVRSHYIMLQRNLIYTGITRAKNRLVLVADPFSVERAVKNDKVAERYSNLAAKITIKKEESA